MRSLDSGGVFVRLIRALRLDPTLYEEVGGSGGSTWQASSVMCAFAVASGLHWGGYTLFYLVTAETVSSDLGAAAVQSSVPAAWSSAVAYLVAWPVWAIGLWIVGSHWTPAHQSTAWFGQIARPLVYAQAPAILGVVYVLLIAIISVAFGPQGLRSAVTGVAQFGLWAVMEVWVLAGTFLAVRGALSLSNARTLGALVLVGAVIAALLGLVVVILSAASGGSAVGLRDDFIVGFTDDGPTALEIAKGLDFNLRFVGQSQTVLNVLATSVLHPFAN